MVLLAYSRGLISSRKIEQACRENVVFIALACGQQHDHSTIAAFVSSMKDGVFKNFGYNVPNEKNWLREEDRLEGFAKAKRPQIPLRERNG